MYTEEYEKRGFPIGNFLAKLILVAVFALLLVWFVPKYLSPVVKTDTRTTCAGSTCDTAGIKALTSQIFAENMERMKDAAISYYTDERLPQEVGQSKKMTLADMIGEKIIVPLIDKNNKAVDVDKSYVQITKANDEYILKVNLKDSETEDYILVHLGCYTYCDSYICEKRPSTVGTKSAISSTVPIKGSISDGTYYAPTIVVPVVTPTEHKACMYDSYTGNFYDAYGNKTSKLNYLKSCLKPVCKKVSGYYFDKNGNNVSYSEYERSCSQGHITETYYCEKVNGYYYDKNGNRVSYEQYKKSCGVAPEETKYICKIVNGDYYDSEGNKVSKVEYIKNCKKPICEKISGYYFGLDGDVVSEAQFNKECGTPTPPPEPEWLYEYSKTTGAEFSAWTKWSDWSKTNCATQVINCSDTDITCLKKLQLYKRKEKIGTYQNTYSKTREQIVQTGSYTQKSCNNYQYIEINKKLYVTTKTYTQINTITKATTHTTGSWTYNGRGSYANPPRDSGNTRYIFVGADYSYCNDTCTSLPNYYYDSYTYSAGMESVSSTTTPGSVNIDTSSDVYTQTSYEARCGGYTVKTIPIYGTITVTEKATRTEPLYGDVCYQSTKTRTIIDEGSTKYKWSTYNDTTLLNNGWHYTGNKRQK